MSRSDVPGRDRGAAEDRSAGNGARDVVAGFERGDAIDRYVVLDRLGQGTAGAVLRAHDPELDRTVAIKLLRADQDAGPEARVRLQREAQALAKLSHPNVVRVFDVGTAGGQIFVAMELVDRSLGQWLAEQPRSWPQILDAFKQAARGLAAAHRAGLVHRDFKPANALVSADGVVCVTDFGLVTLRTAEAPTHKPPQLWPSAPSALEMQLTARGALIGTPAYMAPEQFAGQPVDARADQFAWCVALFRALYGRRPYPGRTMAELRATVLAGLLSPPPPESPVPAWIGQILCRGLATDPTDRFPSMDALLEALERDPAQEQAGRLAARALLELGAAESASGDVDAAQASLRQALRTARQVGDCLGEAEALVRLVYVLGVQAERHDEALALCTEAAPVLDRAAADALLRSRLDNHRGMVLQAAGEHDRAVVAYRAALDAIGRSGRPADPDLTVLLNNLGSALRETGDCEQARDAHARAVDVARHAGPSESTALAEAHDGLARCHEALGNRDQAADHWASAIGLYEKLARKDAPYFVELRNEYGLLLQELGRYDEAREQLSEAVALIDRLENEGHEAAVVYASFGVLLREMGELALARTYTERALAMEQQRLGEDHAGTAFFFDRLGAVLLEAGELEAARTAFTRALRLGAQALPEDHPSHASAHNGLGAALLALGEHEHAQSHFRWVLGCWERAHGPDHPDVAIALGNLARALIDAGQPSEALGYAQRAVQIRLQAYGADHPDLGLSLSLLGDLEYARGEHDVARGHFARAVELLERAVGASHPSVAVALTGLGNCHLALNQPSAAVVPLERAVAIHTASPSSPAVRANACFALGLALWHSGRDLDRALSLARTALADYRTLGPAAARPTAQVFGWLAERGHEPTAS